MLPDKMVKFIRKHHVMTLSVCSNNNVWSAHCFYAYNEKHNFFVFTSDDDTEHVKIMRQNNKVSLAIARETKVVGKIKGLQIAGVVIQPENIEYEFDKALYLKRFPYAAAMKISLWAVKPESAKMTDNLFGIGNKLKWSKSAELKNI